MTTAKPLHTGGCQCGAIRFALSASPAKVSICHCRMCQKASGTPFASFAEIEKTDFVWTRGQPAAFRSSSIAERDFCAACGTPLSWVVGIANLPSQSTQQNYGPEKMATIVSHQHPDHD
jgi:hypothetical protein